MFFYLLISLLLSSYASNIEADEVIGCGGFVQSKAKLNYDAIKVKLLTNRGVLKYSSDCAPNNGYYFIPLYDHGNYTIRIDAPKGWTFEPNEIHFYFDGNTDICSTQSDVNFVFQGFALLGKVRSLNSQDGPKGVQVVLTSKQTSTKLENVTEEGGSFSFTNLQSGQYVLEFAHPSWKFSQNKINVEISNDNADLDKLGKAIEVLSYSFSASVLSDSRPMGDVQFLLFGNKVSSFNYECNRARPALVDKLVEANNDIEYLCYVLSNNEGVVKLNLPNGKYALHPFYERHGIRFDVSPVKYEFEILHDDIVETEAFEIGGFTITGKVVNSLNPNIPVNDAQVVLLQHNSVITSTHVNPTTGWYKFENIKTSDYVIRTKATHFLFEDVAVSISPNNPQLPTLSPSKYRVCANVELDPNLQAHQVELVIRNKNSNAIFKRLPIVSNNVCEFLPGAHYLFSVVSKSSELKFVPAELLVNVDQPKTDLQFTQFSTRISGQIEFSNSQEALKANDDSALILQKSGVVLEMINVADLKRTNNLISFQFKNILPGKYSLSLGGKLKTTFCWQKDSFDINVEESDVPNVNFKQNGYHFQAVSSHATALQLKSPSGKLETHNVETGKVLEHCLQEPGRYQLIPIGCHKFVEDGEHLFYDTQQTEGEIVKLVALKHSAKVVIVSDINITDLSLNVDVMHHNQQHRRQIALPELQASQADGHYQYSLVLYERPTSNIQIEPKSEQLLFRPSTAVVDLSNDCAVEDVVFKARAGMFINGHVEGDIDGVQIDVFDKQSDALLATAFTAADGRYTVGPFDADLKVKLVAAKEGYTFKSSPTILGKFAPQKHSSFRVNIVDVEGLPLRDVLVSISGGENNFRKNSFVDEDGSIKFDRLDDGEYFIRFVRKEYQFDPSSEMVTLADGQSFERTVVGTQVAFSCFGNVVSLNGEPEVGVAIEAVGVAAGVGSAIDCAAQQEETVSEADGTFRIMGLLPECEYTVRLKVDDRDAIRESVPTRYTIRPTNNDTKDVRFMIVYKQFQTDLVASIEVDEAILPSLSLLLYKDSDSKNILFQTSKISSPFIFLPQLPLDQEHYTLRLDSNLEKSLYDFKPITHNFVTNQSFVHLHIKFAPRLLDTLAAGGMPSLSAESESPIYPAGRVYIAIVAVVLALVYYHKRLREFSSTYFRSLGNIRLARHSTTDASAAAAGDKGSKENANGKKKMKLKKI